MVDESADAEGDATTLRLRVLANGLDFIQSALDYLAEPDDPVGAKYAVLHLSAGVELVLKARLEREHWTLVFADPRQADRTRYDVGNFRSVTLDDVLKRLRAVCNIDVSDETCRRFIRFREKRNQFEHHSVDTNIRAIQAESARTLSLLIDFIIREFEDDHLEEAELASIASIRQTLSSVEAFVARRRQEIAERLAAAERLGRPIVPCPICLELAANLSDEEGACLFCGYHASSLAFQGGYLDTLGHWSPYEDIKQGGIWPVYFCPSCGAEHLVFDPATNRDAICFSCGCRWRSDELDFCTRCNAPFEPTEGELICYDCLHDLASG